MLESMTAKEYAELRIICKHEVIGYDRQDFHAARIAMSMSGGKITDHLPPRIKPSEPDQTPEDAFETLLDVTWQPSQNFPSSSTRTPPA